MESSADALNRGEDPFDTVTVSPTPGRLRVDARQTERSDRFVPVAASPTPRLSWSVPLLRDLQEQTAFEVVIRDADNADHWRSGVVESADPWTRVERPLAANAQYRFSARTRDEYGQWSPWAADVVLETGPFALCDWGGSAWIAHPPLTQLRRAFSLAGPASRARLHLTAQGLVRGFVNGVAVNGVASDPSRTDLGRALYRSYDVTDLLQPGENTLDLALARGEWERAGLDPRVLAVLVTEDAHGARAFHGTGPGLLTAPSPVTLEEAFYLEAQDLRTAREFVPATITVLTAADQPESAAEPPASVSPDPAPPLHVVDRIRPVLLSNPAPGVRVFDVGVNIAGRSRITFRTAPAGAGTVIQVVHGEHLDIDGRLDTTNLTMPYDHGRVRQAVQYTLGDAEAGVLEPWFCYHGFRYFEITGIADDAEIEVEVGTLHSDLDQIGTLSSDAPAVDQLLRHARRTLLNNVHGIPEDCPTREQSGWTGDTASVTEFEFAAFDMQAFFAKWLGDLRTSQQPDGAIPAIAPDIRAVKAPADPVWGAALQRVLLGHWLHYGDADIVRETLPALRRWVDFQLSCVGVDGTVDGSPISYGHDWLALQQTPPELHHTAATLDSLRVLADFEELLGDPTLAELRRSQATTIRAAARVAFVRDGADGSLVVGNGSQGSLAVAVEGGWLTGADAVRASRQIERDVRQRGNRVSSGFATTRSVIRTLAAHGHSQAIFDALHQPNEPGVGAMLAHGPGTFWECWWIDPTNTGTGSLDHIGLGGPFAGWAWTSLAGLRPIAPGYRRFLVEPAVVDGLGRVDTRTETVRGTIELAICRTGSFVEISLVVPVGSEAVVRIPGSTDRVLGTGRHQLTAEISPAERICPPVEATPWQPPMWEPSSADVVGDETLIPTAIANDAVEPVGGSSSVDILENGVRCMPVPHAQIPGPILRVRGQDPAAADGPFVRLRFDAPLDLSAARFAFAMIDLCIQSTVRPAEPLVRLISADGSHVEATSRLWPAGWVRVSVPLEGWAGAQAVVAIEAGLRYLDTDAPEESPYPAAFHLGRVGYSLGERTWP